MTAYHAADLRKWTDEQKRKVKFIAADATQELSRRVTRRHRT